MTGVPIRTLIVDDEPLARRRLRSLLAPHQDFMVLGEAADGDAAATLIALDTPDLVFLDIQMPGRDGLGVAAGLPASKPVLVFVTAFDRFAHRAFDLDAADYLLKPYDMERFDAMLGRVRRRLGLQPLAALAPLDHLVASRSGQVRLLSVPMIERIDAAGNYAEVTMAGGKRYLVRSALAALADQLPAIFLRVHRSVIIRVDRVAAIVSTGHGDAHIQLADATTAPLSRRYRAALMAAVPALKSR